MVVKFSVATLVLLICIVSLFYSSTGTSNAPSSYRSEIRLAELWNNTDSGTTNPLAPYLSVLVVTYCFLCRARFWNSLLL
ncbi:hypothetical protein AHAS_Ahas01G0102300 [Arachis hypogaea]